MSTYYTLPDSQGHRFPQPHDFNAAQATEIPLTDLELGSSIPLPSPTTGSRDTPLSQSSASGPSSVRTTAGVVGSYPGSDADQMPLPPPRPYLRKARELSWKLPHLRNVLAPSPRQGRPQVDCYDFHKGSMQSLRTMWGGEEADSFMTEEGESLTSILEDLLAQSESDPMANDENASFGSEAELMDDNRPDLKVLVASDLTSGLIDCLGSVFSMNPEFFEEHLQNSGWRNDEEDLTSESWLTQDMAKDYVSFNWFKPVEPVPLDTHYAKWETKRSGHSWWETGNGVKKNHTVALVTNVVRSSWFSLMGHAETPMDSLFGASEERATIWSGACGSCKIVIILLDPTPEVREFIRSSFTSQDPNRQDSSLLANRVTPPLPLYPNVKHRGYNTHYSTIMSNIVYFDQFLSADRTTCRILLTEIANKITSMTSFKVLKCLLTVIQMDILNLIRVMDGTLTTLAHDMLDDNKVQDRLLDWRYQLERFDRHLIEVENSFQRFAKYLMIFPEGQGREADVDVAKSLQQISKLRNRFSKTSKSLLASISILESKKGIAEAESVTKLTELAFFFIPLTFSASIFSMQVKELGSSVASIWWFFVVAAGITTSSYVLRLAIRSSLIIEPRRKWMDQVRTSSDVAHGSPVPTRAIIIFMWKKFGPTEVIQTLLGSSLVIGLLVTAALLIALWAGSLERGMQISATIYISVLCLSLILFLLSRSYVNKIKQRLKGARRASFGPNSTARHTDSHMEHDANGSAP